MKTYPILILTFALGMLVLGSASADYPLVAPGGGDPLAPIDLSNAGVEEAPIVIAGTPRRDAQPQIACCNTGGSCQTTAAARCAIQGGTPAPAETRASGPLAAHGIGRSGSGPAKPQPCAAAAGATDAC